MNKSIDLMVDTSLTTGAQLHRDLLGWINSETAKLVQMSKSKGQNIVLIYIREKKIGTI